MARIADRQVSRLDRAMPLYPATLLLSIAIHLGGVLAAGAMMGRGALEGRAREDGARAMALYLPTIAPQASAEARPGPATHEADSAVTASSDATPARNRPARPGRAALENPGTFGKIAKALPSDIGTSAQLPALTPIAARYYTIPELTERPVLRKDIPAGLTVGVPDVKPQPARLRLLINEQGEIDNVIIEDSRLPPQAEAFIKDAFEKLKFSPGKVGGLAVKSQLRIEVTIGPPAPADGMSLPAT